MFCISYFFQPIISVFQIWSFIKKAGYFYSPAVQSFFLILYHFYFEIFDSFEANLFATNGQEFFWVVVAKSFITKFSHEVFITGYLPIFRHSVDLVFWYVGIEPLCVHSVEDSTALHTHSYNKFGKLECKLVARSLGHLFDHCSSFN